MYKPDNGVFKFSLKTLCLLYVFAKLLFKILDEKKNRFKGFGCTGKKIVKGMEWEGVVDDANGALSHEVL